MFQVPQTSDAKEYPTNWKTYESLKEHKMWSGIGFVGNGREKYADINRFGNRYRVAKAFDGMKLTGYSNKTIEGYNALMRIFLVWSAFEQFTKILGKSKYRCLPLLLPHDPAKVINFLRHGTRFMALYKFAYPRVNSDLQPRLEDFRQKRLDNPNYLAASIRHLFAHGTLSPGVDNQGQNIIECCDCLFEFYMRVMDAEFTAEVDRPLTAP